MGRQGSAWLLCLPCCPDQRPRSPGIPDSGRTVLALRVKASRPEGPNNLGTDAATLATVAPSTANSAPVARRSLRRQDPSQEPSALTAHAGICAGGAGATGVPTAIGRSPCQFRRRVRRDPCRVSKRQRPPLHEQADRRSAQCIGRPRVPANIVVSSRALTARNPNLRYRFRSATRNRRPT